jgi:hypothetical protein
VPKQVGFIGSYQVATLAVDTVVANGGPIDELMRRILGDILRCLRVHPLRDTNQLSTRYPQTS